MYMPVFPKPFSVNETGGSYSLPAKCEMRVAPGAMDEKRKAVLEEIWGGFTCDAGSVAIVESVDVAEFTATIGSQRAEIADDDEYAIAVSETGICVKGRDNIGLLHGIYTLLQLICPVCLEKGKEKFSVDCASVHDHPALGMRAIHVCLFPETTLNVFEKTIRLAGFLKYTHLILEPWGALQLESFPELAWKDNSYTKAQLKPYIDLCHAMGMEVIPMINHLGHASQSRGGMGRQTVLSQNPRMALLFEPDGWTWCISNPDTLSKLREVREELMEFCGEGGYFHLGCDEAYSYASCPICRSKDKTEMLSSYLNGLCEELAQKGRRAIVWHDQFLSTEEWKYPYVATSRPDQKTHLALEKLDKRIIIADWQYYLTTPEIPTSQYFKDKGFDVLVCPYDDDKNAAAMHAGADRLGLMGAIDTTWHHVNNALRKMLELGGSIWNGESYSEAPGQIIYCAAILRKIMPNANSFEESGFIPHEIDADFSRLLY